MRIIFCILVLAIGGEVWAQQDAQVSLYLRNPLQFNSAHAGLDGTLRSTSIVRMQWTGWEGAPRTQFISAHAPLFRNRLGVGLTALNDASGARSQREFMGHVAYHSPELGNGIHLSTGLSLGVQSAGYDFQSLMARDANDMLLAAPYNAVGLFNGSWGYDACFVLVSWFLCTSFAGARFREVQSRLAAEIGICMRQRDTSIR